MVSWIGTHKTQQTFYAEISAQKNQCRKHNKNMQILSGPSAWDKPWAHCANVKLLKSKKYFVYDVSRSFKKLWRERTFFLLCFSVSLLLIWLASFKNSCWLASGRNNQTLGYNTDRHKEDFVPGLSVSGFFLLLLLFCFCQPTVIHSKCISTEAANSRCMRMSKIKHDDESTERH